MPSAHLWQGDLIRFKDTDDPLKSAGIIITADCDLECEKHAGLITLVSIVSAKTLLEKYLLFEHCEKE